MHGLPPMMMIGMGLLAWIGFWTWIGRRPLRKSRNRPTWQTRAGQAGESKTIQILRHHGLTIWPDVRIATGHRTSQYDQIGQIVRTAWILAFEKEPVMVPD